MRWRWTLRSLSLRLRSKEEFLRRRRPGSRLRLNLDLVHHLETSELSLGSLERLRLGFGDSLRLRIDRDPGVCFGLRGHFCPFEVDAFRLRDSFSVASRFGGACRGFLCLCLGSRLRLSGSSLSGGFGSFFRHLLAKLCLLLAVVFDGAHFVEGERLRLEALLVRHHALGRRSRDVGHDEFALRLVRCLYEHGGLVPIFGHELARGLGQFGRGHGLGLGLGLGLGGETSLLLRPLDTSTLFSSLIGGGSGSLSFGARSLRGGLGLSLRLSGSFGGDCLASAAAAAFASASAAAAALAATAWAAAASASAAAAEQATARRRWPRRGLAQSPARPPPSGLRRRHRERASRGGWP